MARGDGERLLAGPRGEDAVQGPSGWRAARLGRLVLAGTAVVLVVGWRSSLAMPETRPAALAVSTASEEHPFVAPPPGVGAPPAAFSEHPLMAPPPEVGAPPAASEHAFVAPPPDVGAPAPPASSEHPASSSEHPASSSEQPASSSEQHPLAASSEPVDAVAPPPPESEVGERDEAREWRELRTSLTPWTPVEAKSGRKFPHVVLSFIDDQGYADMGYANGGFDQLVNATPFMDTLAGDGIKLSRYYSQQLCTPARAALLTGYYPIHTGMQHDVIQPESTFGLPLSHKLLPSYFKQLGYKCFMIGKWHLGHYKSGYLPHKRGFDEFFGYLSDQLWYYSHKSPHACLGSNCFLDMQHNGEWATDALGVYSTFLFTDALSDVVDRTVAASKAATGGTKDDGKTDESLFVYLAWQNVHAPLDPPPSSYFTQGDLDLLETIDDPHRRTFAALTLILDTATRKVVGSLQRAGIYNDTILVVASDNGGCDASGGYNWPLRGGKQYLYEGGVRVNAFVHSPLLPLQSRGRSYRGLFHVTDWLPTLLLGALNVDPKLLPSDLDGVNQWRALLDPHVDASSERTSVLDYPRTEILHNIDRWSLWSTHSNMTLLTTPIQAIRVGDMKLIMGQDLPGFSRPRSAACPDGAGDCASTKEATDDCQYSYDDTVYLFNITADPSETVNLAQTSPHIVARLEARLAEYADTMVDMAYKGCDYDDAYSVWIHKNDDFIGPFMDPDDLDYYNTGATSR